MKTFIFIISLIFYTNTMALTLSSRVDRTTLGIDDTLKLTVSIDKQGAGSIDFSALDLQFDILHTQNSSQTSIINGKINAKTQWTLLLAPKESGKLVIPSFSSNGVYSDAIPITVTKSRQHNTHNTNKDIFLSLSTDKTSVYVQEQLLVSVRLYYRVSLSGYTAQDLVIDNATVTQVEESNFKDNHKGVPYNVLEKVYAVHPQGSGTLTLPSQSWQLEKNSRGLNFGRSINPYLRVRSQAKTVKVLPIPIKSTAKHWLPAKKVTLNQQWQQSTITAKVGEPLSYSLTMSAEGLGYSQLPSIELASNEDFTIYGDQPENNNHTDANGVIGKRIENYAIIPKKAGVFKLPPITLRWWNLNTDKEETITLNSQEIIVANSEINAAPLPPKASLGNTDITTQDSANQQNTSNNHAKPTTHWWQLSSLVFALLALAFFILWQRQSNSITKEAPQQKSPRQPPGLNKLYREIEENAQKEKWPQVNKLLFQWASIVVNHPIKNNEEIAMHFSSLKDTLKRLERQIYSKEGKIIWDAKELIPLLKQQVKQYNATQKQKKNHRDPLNSLYNN